MHFFEFFCYILSFYINVRSSNSIEEYPVYDAVDEFATIFSRIEYIEQDKFDRGKFALLQYLNHTAGKKITDLHSLVAELTISSQDKVCDIEKLPGVAQLDEGEVTYLPSVCIDIGSCSTSYQLATLKNASCSKSEMCCRIDKVKTFKDLGMNFKPYRELPSDWNYDPDLAIIGQYQQISPVIAMKAGNVDKINKTLMDKFPVCGIKHVDPEQQSQRRIRIFFCVRGDLCLKKKLSYVSDTSQKAMNKFCRNVPVKNYYPSKSKKRFCCDSEYINQINIKDKSTGKTIHPFKDVPHVPFYLKYAPGFRASYMCEAYARMLCEDDINECQYSCPLDHRYTKNNKFMYDKWVDGNQKYGEIPHQALLGVYQEGLLLSFYCGGTLISRRWVLSSFRCTSRYGIYANLILLGTNDMLEPFEVNKEEKIYLITNTLYYPFNSSRPDKSRSTLYDYSLFKTHEEVTFSKYIKPACLYHTDPPVNWRELFFTGYGVKRIKFPDLFSKEINVQGYNLWCRPHTLYDKEDHYYSRYGGGLPNILCGRTVGWPSIINKTIEVKFASPCKYDEGGPLQFRLPLPYCMYQVYAVLSSQREFCHNASSMSAFQTVKFVLSNIEDVVWSHPFLEDFPTPLLNPNNFKYDPIWYDGCGPPKCPLIQIPTRFVYGEPEIAFLRNYDIQTVDKLDKGILPNVFNELEILQSNETLCDVDRPLMLDSLVSKEAMYKYIPATCVDHDKCSSEFGGKFSVEACKDISSVCCSVGSRTNITRSLRYNYSLIAHDELFGYKINKEIVFTGRYQDDIPDAEYTLLKDETNRKAIEKEFVCGIKKYIYPKDKILYSPFFCTKLSNCRKSSVPKEQDKRVPRKSWTDICITGSEAVKALEDKTVCCHPLDFVSSNFSKNIPWEFKELPLYLKYVPGLRSAYKCEEYYRYVCENEKNQCVHYNDKDFASPGEIPQMAQIGFIVPKMMFYYCGGAIISSRYIISSATCGFRQGIVANVVLVGNYNQTELHDYTGWEKVYPLREVLHYPFKRKPNFDAYGALKPVPPRGVIDNDIIEFVSKSNILKEFVDIALFRTIEDIDFSPRIRPICLYYNPVNYIRRAVFTGFGYLPEVDTRSELMKTHPMDFRQDDKARRWEDCGNPGLYNNKTYPYYAQAGVKSLYLFCAISAGFRHGPCKYDNGGPLQIELKIPFCSSQLIGVLSAGRITCNEVSPLVFVNVTKFLAEIEEVVWPLPFLDIIYDSPPLCLTRKKELDNIYYSVLNVNS
ncbi:uncharacterized protein LOC124364873 isoform X2 [Homalodisca vitripennis]|uniref:uncharacterized protein LOC124364873 isoform X2 n=1 Tax=Homalodisca vitripennis TaxID=197043 RepID=UPI001EEA64E5|nr:uncharacterized protein LOC124364873 isoform X2 [Homalodisca vitripennis]